MRSCLYLVFGLGLSACAFGAAGSSDTPVSGKDGGAHDAGAFAPKDDAGSGPILGGGGDDASAPVATDSGSPNNSPPDASSNKPPDASTNNTGCSYTGTLATFDFTGEPGNQTSTPAASSAPDVTASAIARATALTPTSGANSINSSAWATSSSLDPTRYYSFSLTPGSGCALDIGSLSIQTQSSSTGPSHGAIATSDDNFAASTSVTSNGTATATLSVTGATGAVEIRVYGFGATSTGGTMRVEGTLTVSGSLH